MPSKKMRGAMAVLAGGLLALSASMLPASAAGTPAPQLQLGTSVDSGWSRLNKLVSADYDRVVDPAASSVVLQDRDGVSVPGALDVDAKDATVLTFRPYRTLEESAAPYTVTITARAEGQDPAVADTVTTRVFRLDALTPRVNSIAADKPAVVATDTGVLVGGKISDLGQSGVSRVELLFYNPAATPGSSRPVDMKLAQSFTCADNLCPSQADYAFDITDLPIGYWTVRAVAYDLAGNKSSESGMASFLWAKPSA